MTQHEAGKDVNVDPIRQGHDSMAAVGTAAVGPWFHPYGWRW